MLYFKEPVHTTTNGIPTYEGAEAEDSTPFRAYLIEAGATPKISISRYSSVLNSTDIKDRVAVIGVDAPIEIRYGDKVWIETFFDRNLEPVFCMIGNGPKWDAVTLDTSSQTVETLVYPDELEFITKYDIENKIEELQSAIDRIETLRLTVIDDVNSQKNMGFILEARANEIITAINEGYQGVTQLVQTYRGNMNGFFDGSPVSNWKKLFRTYTLICYTTKDTNYKLDGRCVSPGIVVPTTTPFIPTATPDPIFKIVQCLNSDLLLVDICHQNRFPARLPMPYHRPVYNFVYQGKNEDDENTK